jgi:GMP synthase (glutamine-hydrolysing)
MPRRWVCFQHVTHEGPGQFTELTASRGIQLDVYQVGLEDGVPRLHDAEALLVMGGPMGVYETEKYPWLTEECARICELVQAGRLVLGICLGAQLLAHALGATVFRGPTEEIGFGPVTLTEAAAADPVFRAITSPLSVFHWHQDTFDLPEGAVLLASSAQYRNQAFRVGTRAYGLQFHVELDDSLWQDWLPYLPADIASKDSRALRVAIERAGNDLLNRVIELADG